MSDCKPNGRVLPFPLRYINYLMFPALARQSVALGSAVHQTMSLIQASTPVPYF